MESIKIYFVLENLQNEIEYLKIQIGCVLRLQRLKKGMFQLELSLKFESNPTLIGRIERGEVISGWDKIFMLIRFFDIQEDIFTLKSKSELIRLVKESRKLENKLTSEKLKYYQELEE